MSSPIVGMQEAAAITPRQKFEGHTRYVYGAIHLSGGQRIITCSVDGSLRVWNLKSGKQIGDDWRDGESGVYTIALSPDGKKVASGGEWDIDTGKVIAKWMGHTKGVRTVCWSGDGQRVLSGSYDGTARQWDVENGETVPAPIKTGHEYVFAAVYSSDMTMFATAGREQPKSPVKIWDAKIGELVATLKGHTNSASCLVWTPDGKTLISGSSNSSIIIWSTTTWKQIAVLDGHTDNVHSIAISPNGHILASASLDCTARLYNLDNNQPISSPLLHAGFVFSVSFSADGKLLATGWGDKSAYTWDVSAIVKKAGLDDLLSESDKSVLAANATRHPVRQPIKVSNWVPQPRGAPIELHERRSTDVYVPYAKGKRRNASAREKRRPIPRKAITSSSRPLNVMQPSSGAVQAQSSSQSQGPISTSSPSPAVVATPKLQPALILV